ncbi:MAG: PorV/PorQ family protein [Melioribacteraceae bacterium]|nr:PorV/PorQ family protein [Melioribacteraceae bacterium]MCF8264469.1 PorV/PorQ family protein [Melioribacteraceae bacterium]
MLKIKPHYKLLLIATLLCFNSSFAQNVSKTGTTAASFLEIGVGAGANGIGGAFVSIADNASALYWNPGGIAGLSQFEVIVVHTDWIAETNFDFAGLVLPLGDFGTLGLSFTSLSMDDMKVTTVELPGGTGEYFSASDIAVGVSYARNLTDRFSIGFTLKYIEQRIWHMSASAFAIDAGTKFRTDLLGGLTIGATMSNFGTPMELNGRDARYFIRVDQTKQGSTDQIPTSIEMDTWELPLIFQIGISTYAVNTDLYKVLIATDAMVPNNNYQSMNFGAEFSYNDYLFIRGGYNSAFLNDSEGGLSVGAGLNTKMIFSDAVVNFDYAFRDFGRLQSLHNFSVGIKF